MKSKSPSVRSARSVRSFSAIEDYLERIYELITTKGYARVVDIAASLGVSQASVTNMLQRLDADGLVNYEKYRGLILTEQGEDIARHIRESHLLLHSFFELLGVPEKVIDQDIEGMEHHLSAYTTTALQSLFEELKSHPKMVTKISAKVKACSPEKAAKLKPCRTK